MTDKLDKLLAELDPEDVQELLNRINRSTQPKDNGKIIRLGSQQDAPQPVDKKPGGRVFHPVNTGQRRNKFLDMKESQMYKSDSKVDKKLWENTEVSERREPVQKYAISCSRCGREYILLGLSHVHRDTETGEYVYVCDNCIGSK